MTPKRIRTCVLYVRISRLTEESVSIERQVEAGEAYAKARGWEVVGVFRDEGVSATSNKPENRAGWQALMASPVHFDAVVVWKVDRLARRVIDFLNASDAIKARKAGIVAVADPIDMTTSQGEAFATMLAVFGQMEADAIRDRVAAARDKLLRNGRYPGGVLPYGFKSAPNPTGGGYIVVQDKEQVETVREMVRRTMAGRTIYSTLQWLNEEGIPTKTGKVGGWRYTTLDRLLRHPMLAGMVPHNPGNTTSHVRGDDVVRDEDGLPLVDDRLAIVPLGEWRTLQAKLEEPTKYKTPWAMRRPSSGVLSGLIWCADSSHEEPLRMYRGSHGTKDKARPTYYCKECHQLLSNAEELIIPEFLREAGDEIHFTPAEEVVEGGSLEHQEASIRIGELGRELVTAQGDRIEQIMRELARMKEIQAEAAAKPSEVKLVWKEVGTFREDWEKAADDDERRAILGHAFDRVLVRRGRPGEKKLHQRLARLTIEWTMGRRSPDLDELAATHAGE